MATLKRQSSCTDESAQPSKRREIDPNPETASGEGRQTLTNPKSTELARQDQLTTLCIMFYEKLPRELRDMIYEHIGTSIYKVRLILLPSFGLRNLRKIISPFPPAMLHEYAQTFYRMKQFDLDDADNLQDSLNTEVVFYPGLTTKLVPKMFIRRLTVAIRVDLLAGKQKRLPPQERDSRRNMPDPILLHRLVASFKELKTVEHQKGFRLDIQFHTGTDVGVERFYRTLSSTQSVVAELQDVGFKIRFRIISVAPSLRSGLGALASRLNNKSASRWHGYDSLKTHVDRFCRETGRDYLLRGDSYPSSIKFN